MHTLCHGDVQEGDMTGNEDSASFCISAEFPLPLGGMMVQLSLGKA